MAGAERPVSPGNPAEGAASVQTSVPAHRRFQWNCGNCRRFSLKWQERKVDKFSAPSALSLGRSSQHGIGNPRRALRVRGQPRRGESPGRGCVEERWMMYKGRRRQRESSRRQTLFEAGQRAFVNRRFSRRFQARLEIRLDSRGKPGLPPTLRPVSNRVN